MKIALILFVLFLSAVGPKGFKDLLQGLDLNDSANKSAEGIALKPFGI